MNLELIPVPGFMSYAHLDEEWRDRICKNLRYLEYENRLDLWFDGRLTPGDDFHKKIAEKLTTAKLVLLLVSENFLSSQFSYKEELQKAMAMQKEEATRIVPILIRECNWRNSWIGSLQVLPSNATPLENWDNLNDGLIDISNGIAIALNQISKSIPKQDPELALFSKDELLEMIGNVDRALVVLNRAIAGLPIGDTNKLIEIDQLEHRKARYVRELDCRGHQTFIRSD